MNTLKSNVCNVFIYCCLSMFTMDILMWKHSSIANLITFLQFICTAGKCFLSALMRREVKPKIPISQYVILVALYFTTSVANNFVYSLHVPSTLHMIIRSTSLPASMTVTWLVKGTIPKKERVIGSCLVTLGVILATYGGSTVVDSETPEFMQWCGGVTLLLAMSFAGAFSGLQQERLYQKYGSHPEEMLLYTHALPIPFFLPIHSSIISALETVNDSWDHHIGWLIIAINLVVQFNCAKSVHKLATTESAVTVTLILTLRKFTSLIISAAVFQSQLTWLHLIGTVLVVSGTVVYFEFFGYSSRKTQSPAKSVGVEKKKSE